MARRRRDSILNSTKLKSCENTTGVEAKTKRKRERRGVRRRRGDEGDEEEEEEEQEEEQEETQSCFKLCCFP